MLRISYKDQVEGVARFMSKKLDSEYRAELDGDGGAIVNVSEDHDGFEIVFSWKYRADFWNAYSKWWNENHPGELPF